jgi:TPR repeat protein
MIGLKEDRVDVLMKKAREGDPKAQYKLAKWFQKGRLVVQSNEQAAYWAFKSLNNGYLKAQKLLVSIKY